MNAWETEYANGRQEYENWLREHDRERRFELIERVGHLEGAIEAAIIIMRLRDGWETDYASPSLLETAARHLQSVLEGDPAYVEARRKRDE